MTIVYHRNCLKPEALEATSKHVRDTILDQAEGDPLPSEVSLSYGENEDGSTKVFGVLEGYDASTYDLPEGYVEPSRNRQQRGFGERVMTPEQLQEHLLEKGEVFGA